MIDRLTPSIGSELSQQHFAVVDGLLGLPAATAMRQEILALHQVRDSGEMQSLPMAYHFKVPTEGVQAATQAMAVHGGGP